MSHFKIRDRIDLGIGLSTSTPTSLSTSLFYLPMALNRGIYICAAKRTPFGKFGGTLKDFTPTQLAVHAAKACFTEADIDPAIVDTW